jgi:hypothetical protein
MLREMVAPPRDSDNEFVWPEGTYADLHWTKQVRSHLPGHVIYIRETHVGLTLSLHESNGYNDSDFYAHVWNPREQKIETITYATTRGWSYPCYNAVVDATDDVRQLAASYGRKVAEERERAYQEHVARIDSLIAGDLGLPGPDEVKKLRSALGASETTTSAKWEEAQRLLSTLRRGTFRSTFRESLAKQIMAWVTDPSPNYPRPLSPRQWQRLGCC